MIILVRQEALVELALVEISRRVDGAQPSWIIEEDGIRTSAHDGPVCVEQVIDSATAAEAKQMHGEPRVRDGGIPRPRDMSERVE